MVEMLEYKFFMFLCQKCWDKVMIVIVLLILRIKTSFNILCNIRESEVLHLSHGLFCYVFVLYCQVDQFNALCKKKSRSEATLRAQEKTWRTCF